MYKINLVLNVMFDGRNNLILSPCTHMFLIRVPPLLFQTAHFIWQLAGVSGQSYEGFLCLIKGNRSFNTCIKAVLIVFLPDVSEALEESFDLKAMSRTSSKRSSKSTSKRSNETKYSLKII